MASGRSPLTGSPPDLSRLAGAILKRPEVSTANGEATMVRKGPRNPGAELRLLPAAAKTTFASIRKTFVGDGVCGRILSTLI